MPLSVAGFKGSEETTFPQFCDLLTATAPNAMICDGKTLAEVQEMPVYDYGLKQLHEVLTQYPRYGELDFADVPQFIRDIRFIERNIGEEAIHNTAAPLAVAAAAPAPLWGDEEVRLVTAAAMACGRDGVQLTMSDEMDTAVLASAIIGYIATVEGDEFLKTKLISDETLVEKIIRKDVLFLDD